MDLKTILKKLTSDEQEYITNLIEKDALTGVYNRRKFDRDIELIVSMCDRTGKGSSLLIIDIDHFKQFNDKNGHQEGDRLLSLVASVISSVLRGYDSVHVYRYGGDEFVVMLTDTTTKDAVAIAQRMRERVKQSCPLTVSIGVSHYKEVAKDLYELLQRADEALYNTKNGGRDAVRVSNE